MSPSFDRLQAYFRLARARRRSPRLAPDFNRLAQFLRDAHELFRRPTQAQPPPSLNLNFGRLTAALATLKRPLALARAQGKFLNVWAIAGLKRDEVRNAAVLATLFDPRRCGEQARTFLAAFLSRLRNTGAESLPSDDELQEPYTVDTEVYPIGNMENRLDISIDGPSFLLVVEIKIKAPEGDHQLDGYLSVMNRRAQVLGKRPSLIFLSPRPPRMPMVSVTHASWRDVVLSARDVIGPKKSIERGFNVQLLEQFASHVVTF